MKETDRRFFWLQGKLIAFFSLAAAGLAAMLVFIGVERGVFISSYQIYFTIDRGTGLFESMPVKLSGFKIGKIESLELTGDAKVKATLSINQKYRKWIRKNSQAILSKESLLGESVIEITLGGMDEPVIQDGAEIGFYRNRGLEDMAEGMLPVLLEIKEIVAYVNDPEGDFKQMLRHTRRLAEDLHTTEDTINQLVQAAQGRMSRLEANSAKTLQGIDSLSASMEQAVRQAGGRLPAMLDKLDRSLDNIEQASSKLKAATDSTATSLPALLTKGENLLDDTQQVVGSLKQTWPIRPYVQEPKERLLRGDSHE